MESKAQDKQAEELTTRKPVQASLESKYLAYKTEGLAFDVEAWYPLVSHVTATTEFINISEEEALAMKHFYQTNFAKRNNLQPEHVQLLRALEKRIADCMKKSFKGGSCFARMSARSPKDGQTLNSKQVVARSEELKRRFKAEWDKEPCPIAITPEEIESNVKMIAFFKATTEALQCSNEKDVMSLLLTSERIFHDLNVALLCAEAERRQQDLQENWSTRLALRRWEPRIDDLMEFRVFVKNNRLTAISQYNHYIIVRSLLDETYRNEVKVKLTEFWRKELKQLLQEKKDYIVDLAVLSDNSVYLIEMNPFAPTTGASMFDWRIDDELLHGKKLSESESIQDIPLKIRTEMVPNLEQLADYFEGELREARAEDPYYVLLEKVLPLPRTEQRCTIY